MLLHFGTEGMCAEWPESVVAVGTFDGVHLGHRAVVGQAVALAEQRGVPSWVVTFDRHPLAILAPASCPPCVAPLEDNLAEFSSLGLTGTVVLRFDHQTGQTTASEFLGDTLVGALKAKALVIGYDSAFGRNREATASWLAERIETLVVPPQEVGGERVSSRRIRELVAEGDMERVRTLLGRPYSLSGVVVGGLKLGRDLGYPTVNLALSVRQAQPRDGVYAGRCTTRFGGFTAAISIGSRPTVPGAKRSVEAFLLDYPGNSLYGSPVRLEVFRRLRDQRKFDTLDQLGEQMQKDVVQAGDAMANQ